MLAYSLSARSATQRFGERWQVLPSTVTGSSPFSHSNPNQLLPPEPDRSDTRRPAHRPVGNADRSRLNQSQYDERLFLRVATGDFGFTERPRSAARLWYSWCDVVYRASSDGLRRCRDRCARLVNINHAGAPFAGSCSIFNVSIDTVEQTFTAQRSASFGCRNLSDRQKIGKRCRRGCTAKRVFQFRALFREIREFGAERRPLPAARLLPVSLSPTVFTGNLF